MVLKCQKASLLLDHLLETLSEWKTRCTVLHKTLNEQLMVLKFLRCHYGWCIIKDSTEKCFIGTFSGKQTLWWISQPDFYGFPKRDNWRSLNGSKVSKSVILNGGYLRVPLKSVLLRALLEKQTLWYSPLPKYCRRIIYKTISNVLLLSFCHLKNIFGFFFGNCCHLSTFKNFSTNKQSGRTRLKSEAMDYRFPADPPGWFHYFCSALWPLMCSDSENELRPLLYKSSAEWNREWWEDAE